MQKNDSKNPEMVQKFAVQRNADLKPCRARKMLKNAPTLAIGGADTAENGPSKVRQVSNKIRHNIGSGIPCLACVRGIAMFKARSKLRLIVTF